MSSTGADVAWLCASGIMSGGSGKESGRLPVEHGTHASTEAFLFTLIYAPPLRPRCKLLIPLPRFVARSDLPHENEQSELQGEV